MNFNIQLKADGSVLGKLFAYLQVQKSLNSELDISKFIKNARFTKIYIIFYAYPSFHTSKIEDTTKFRSKLKHLELHINLDFEMIMEMDSDDVPKMLLDFFCFHLEEFVNEENFDHNALAQHIRQKFEIE